MVTTPAVAANVMEVDPCGTVTDGGMYATAGDALSPMFAPPLGAAVVSVTVHVDPAAGESEVGLHEMPLKAGVWRMVTVPLLTVVGRATPVVLADTPFVNCTVEEVSEVELAKVSVTSAATLLGIGDEFRPHTRHVALPAPFVQVSVLFAAPTAGAKVADVKSAVE